MDQHQDKTLKKALEEADKAVYASQLESNSDNIGYSHQAIERVEQALKGAPKNSSPTSDEQHAKDMLRRLKETQAAVNSLRND
ncbi:hypothetical protein [Sutcliffiella horikoshii]|uniref:Uncharacterized protein n=1 Tax=Sutcliffiella horikoshii TaxID=79883 RepID=A0A5D4T3W5_9BACI|nr:hypothetical protein [Sutcliffiella horikoshii]TYS69348.1 hypothetical protein FZC75_17500 [Sutcliffiella horikoshii]